MKGIIIADNTREPLLPLTQDTTKPMLNFLDKPLIEVSLNLFKKHNITDITVMMQSENPELKEYLQKREGIRADCLLIPKEGFSFEEITNEEEDCLIFHQIAVTDIDLQKAIQFHISHHNTATIIYPDAFKNQHRITYEDNGSIKEFHTPSNQQSGIYLLHKNAFSIRIQSMQELFALLIAQNMSVHILYEDGYFSTIDTIEEYIDAARESLENKYLQLDYKPNNGVILNRNTFIEVGAKIKPPVYIGENVSIQKNAEILPYSIVCNNTTIAENAKISNSIIFEHCNIMKNATVTGAVLAGHVTVSENAGIHSGAIFGQYTKVPAQTQTEEGISPPKAQTLSIGKNGILLQKENICQFLLQLGTAFAEVFDGIVGLFKDDSTASELFSHCLHAGLKAGGSKVYEFPDCTFSMCKSACLTYHMKASCYLQCSGETKTLFLLDENGNALSSEAVQKLDTKLKLAHAVKIPPYLKKTTIVPAYQPYYLAEITRRLGTKKADCTLVFESDSVMLSEYMQKIAVCHSITLTKEHLPGKIHFLCDGSGRSFRIYDENGTRLTPRQIETLIASLILESSEKEFVATLFTSEALQQYLKKNDITLRMVPNHPHEIDKALASLPEQQYLSYDPVYLITRILIRLSEHSMTLAQWNASLPKSFFIEKTVSAGEHLTEALSKLLKIAKNNYKEDHRSYKLESKKGVTIVTPEKDQLKIISESTKEEYAKELTDFYITHCSDIIKSQ